MSRESGRSFVATPDAEERRSDDVELADSEHKPPHHGRKAKAARLHMREQRSVCACPRREREEYFAVPYARTSIRTQTIAP